MSVEATDVQVNETVERLRAILEEVWAGGEGRSVEADLALRDLGVDSGAVVALLVRAQAEFGIEWPDDLPPGALESLDKVARTVLQCRQAS